LTGSSFALAPLVGLVEEPLEGLEEESLVGLEEEPLEGLLLSSLNPPSLSDGSLGSLIKSLLASLSVSQGFFFLGLGLAPFLALAASLCYRVGGSSPLVLPALDPILSLISG